MSKAQMLRCLVSERLTAAAEEIFALFERTIAEYEEELCRSKEENQRKQRLLDSESPQVLHRADVQIQGPEEKGTRQQKNTELSQFRDELNESVKQKKGHSTFTTLTSESADGEEINPAPQNEGEETKSFIKRTRLSNQINDSDPDDDDWIQNSVSAVETMETESEGDTSARPADTPRDTPGEGGGGIVWEPISPEAEPMAEQTFSNIFSDAAAPTFHARTNITDPQSAFLCLLDLKTLQCICECTAAEARYSNPDAAWDLSVPELKAFLSLLFAQTAYNKHVTIEGLWSDEWGLPFFSSTMPRNRFREIMRHLSFEKKDQRRDYSDMFAPIADVWSAFVANCGVCFTPGANLALDEYVLPHQDFFLHSKSLDEITMCTLVDVETKYFLNGFPYCSKDFELSLNKNLAVDIVTRLTEPYLGNGRNVTVKSKWTSLSLAQNLLKNNTTLVGALSSSRSELPKGVRERRELYDTQLFRCGEATLTVYQGQTHQSVAVLSTLHQTVRILNTCKRQPHTVNFYSRTKTAVASLEQMSCPFSVKRKTRKWTVAVFYHLLDLAATNAWILLQTCTSSVPLQRFVLQLAQGLRADLASLKARPRELSFCEPLERDPTRRKQCRINRKCKQNKTSLCCRVCTRPVCGKCVGRVDNFCPQCL